MNRKQKKLLTRIVVALVLFVVFFVLAETGLLSSWVGHPADIYLEFVLFLIPFLIAGYDVLLKAARNIGHGQIFDESFLMSVATLGAFALVFFPESDPHMSEGAAVMIFFQIGELFESIAVRRTRTSIAQMMDIAPESTCVKRNGALIEVPPESVAVGEQFVVRPGEKVSLDGVVIEGTSRLDTAALTGEALPVSVVSGSEVISGCVNLDGALTIEALRPYSDSTVARILALVEGASERKARTESFINRFARWYTPIVVGAALLLAIVPPLFVGDWASWVERALIFLVVSCPCALVISVPLAFFAGIGGASRQGVLVKGGNYLEALGRAQTVAFDKTGTLTTGQFALTSLQCAPGIESAQLIRLAAAAEELSTHPVATAIRARADEEGIEYQGCAHDVVEHSGNGVCACIDDVEVLVGSAHFLQQHAIDLEYSEAHTTRVYVARDGRYLGMFEISDTCKTTSAQAVRQLHYLGIERVVMLTGDQAHAAERVAQEVGVDAFEAELLPQDKVAWVEASVQATENTKHSVVFVGDGINDAPVLMRADCGIAMGAMGSDAAIEAADVVLMDDDPSRVALAIAIARRTVRIVRQNIIFALGVKFAVLALAVVGIANLWLAVFADVGVAVLAILNAMRCMRRLHL